MIARAVPPEDARDDEEDAPVDDESEAGEAAPTETAAETAAEAAPASGAEFLSDVTQIYLHEIGLKPLLTPEEEQRYARLTVRGDFAARQKMIEHNLRLVVNIAKQYLNAACRCSTSSRRATSG